MVRDGKWRMRGGLDVHYTSALLLPCVGDPYLCPRSVQCVMHFTFCIQQILTFFSLPCFAVSGTCGRRKWPEAQLDRKPASKMDAGFSADALEELRGMRRLPFSLMCAAACASDDELCGECNAMRIIMCHNEEGFF